jgi:hypothetical protein
MASGMMNLEKNANPSETSPWKISLRSASSRINSQLIRRPRSELESADERGRQKRPTEFSSKPFPPVRRRRLPFGDRPRPSPGPASYG